MKRIEDIKVDLVNSKWLSFNKVNLEDPLFIALSKALKKDEVVYSIVNGNIILEDKKLAKQSEKLAKLQEKQVKSGKALDEQTEKMMDDIAKELADVKTPGLAMVAMTDARVITVYQDLNKDYKVKVLKKHIEDIQELNASEDADEQGLFNFSINFGKVTVNIVTENETNIKHFEFTLDQLIEIEAEKELNKESTKVEQKIEKDEKHIERAESKPTKTKKATAKKKASKPATKKTTAKKTPAKKPVAKKAPVKKATAKKKLAAKKVGAKKSVKAKKPVAKKATPKKAAKPVAKKTVKKSSAKKAAKPVAKKSSAKKPAKASKTKAPKSKTASSNMNKGFKKFSAQAWKDIKSFDWIWLMFAALMGVGIIITSAIMYGTDWESKYWIPAAACELAFAVIGFVFALIYMLPALKNRKFDYFKGFGLVLYVFIFIVSIIAITKTGYDAINFISYIITVMGIWLAFDNLYTICDPLVTKLMAKKSKAARK